MKIKFFYGLILILTSLSLGAEPAESSLPRPKLVVGIVVDQMRWDYLYRYYDRYGDRGFKRLLKEGFTCENTQLNYLPAFTAVGHTCIYTGSVPSVTGIAANDFYIEKDAPGRWKVVSQKIDNLVDTYDLDDPDQAYQLGLQLDKMGVDRALREAGARDGDQVIVNNYILDFKD